MEKITAGGGLLLPSAIKAASRLADILQDSGHSVDHHRVTLMCGRRLAHDVWKLRFACSVRRTHGFSLHRIFYLASVCLEDPRRSSNRRVRIATQVSTTGSRPRIIPRDKSIALAGKLTSAWPIPAGLVKQHSIEVAQSIERFSDGDIEIDRPRVRLRKRALSA